MHQPDNPSQVDDRTVIASNNIPDVVSDCRNDDVTLDRDDNSASDATSSPSDVNTSLDSTKGEDDVSDFVANEKTAHSNHVSRIFDGDPNDILDDAIMRGLVEVSVASNASEVSDVQTRNTDDDSFEELDEDDSEVRWADVNKKLDDMNVPPAATYTKHTDKHNTGVMKLTAAKKHVKEPHMTVHPVKSHSTEFGVGSSLPPPRACASKSDTTITTSSTRAARTGPPRVRDDLGADLDIKSLDDRKFKMNSNSSEVDFFADMMPTLTPAPTSNEDVGVLHLFSKSAKSAPSASSLAYAIDATESTDTTVCFWLYLFQLVFHYFFDCCMICNILILGRRRMGN